MLVAERAVEAALAEPGSRGDGIHACSRVPRRPELLASGQEHLVLVELPRPAHGPHATSLLTTRSITARLWTNQQELSRPVARRPVSQAPNSNGSVPYVRAGTVLRLADNRAGRGCVVDLPALRTKEPT